MNWQPISSAPKDGTVILIAELPFTNQSAMIPMTGKSRFSELQKRDIWCDYFGRGRYEPTHWQPLPPPPIDSPAS